MAVTSQCLTVVAKHRAREHAATSDDYKASLP